LDVYGVFFIGSSILATISLINLQALSNEKNVIYFIFNKRRRIESYN